MTAGGSGWSWLRTSLEKEVIKNPKARVSEGVFIGLNHRERGTCGCEQGSLVEDTQSRWHLKKRVSDLGMAVRSKDSPPHPHSAHGVGPCAVVCHGVPRCAGCAVVCRGVPWCAAVCCGVPWCAMVCRGVPRCATVCLGCCGVPWCTVVCHGGLKSAALKEWTPQKTAHRCCLCFGLGSSGNSGGLSRTSLTPVPSQPSVSVRFPPTQHKLPLEPAPDSIPECPQGL